MIPVPRIIDKLDSYFASNDIDGAERLLAHWENEAVAQNDISGLLTIANEQIGFYRRNPNMEKAFKAIDIALSSLSKTNVSPLGKATILVNIATTQRAFECYDEALDTYIKADGIFKENDLTKTYEYASFLNNSGTLLDFIGRKDEALANFNLAIDILDKIGGHNAHIALSYANIADATNDPSYMDKAWEEVNKETVRDGEYAFVLTKLAPGFEKFGFTIEARALMEVADDIYKGN